jgi:hypothetical protein
MKLRIFATWLALLSGNVHPVENIPEDHPDDLVVPEVEDNAFPVVIALGRGWLCCLRGGNLRIAPLGIMGVEGTSILYYGGSSSGNRNDIIGCQR